MRATLHPQHHSKYQSLVTERNRLKGILDANKHMRASHNYKVVRAQYELRVKEIKQLYKTHA
jgi:hypothetical protein